MPPIFANGKICYIEIPATDIRRSADFYASVFGWQVRKRSDSSTAFDNGEVSGTWVTDRPPMTDVGLLFYIMVDSVAVTVDAVVANGGEIVQATAWTRRRSPPGSATLPAMHWGFISSLRTDRTRRLVDSRQLRVLRSFVAC
jgi:predicted enzyme related to lactoylglutathione lyase